MDPRSAEVGLTQNVSELAEQRDLHRLVELTYPTVDMLGRGPIDLALAVILDCGCDGLKQLRALRHASLPPIQARRSRSAE